MAGYGDPPIGSSRDMTNTAIGANGSRNTGTTITRAVSYVANGTKSNQILSLSQTASDSVVSYDTPQSVTVSNSGRTPVVAAVGYQAYQTEDATTNNDVYLHAFLLPGETFNPPMRAVINLKGTQAASTHDDFANQSLHVLDGEVVDFTVPNTNLYIGASLDIDNATASGVVGSATSTILYIKQWTDRLVVFLLLIVVLIILE